MHGKTPQVQFNSIILEWRATLLQLMSAKLITHTKTMRMEEKKHYMEEKILGFWDKLSLFTNWNVQKRRNEAAKFTPAWCTTTFQKTITLIIWKKKYCPCEKKKSSQHFQYFIVYPWCLYTCWQNKQIQKQWNTEKKLTVYSNASD